MMMVIDLDFPVENMCKNAWSSITTLFPYTVLQSYEDETPAHYIFKLYSLWIYF